MIEEERKRKKKTISPGKKDGRPPKQINFNEMDKLLNIQCTLREVASFFECSEDTIENKIKEEKGITFSEYAEQKKGSGKRSLRRKQFEIALSGNITMLIWLGKQYLDQSDKQVQTATIQHTIQTEQDIKKMPIEQLLIEIDRIKNKRVTEG
jgi:hypothetical protein